MLMCSERTVINMIHRRDVPALLCGGTWRLERSEMLRAIRCNADLRLAQHG